MSYVMQPLDGLQQKATSLTNEYINEKRRAREEINKQRCQFLQCLASLAKQGANASVITGAVLYELALIKKEYRGVSPRLCKGRLYNTGSWLYSELEAMLGIKEDNSPDDAERLIHVYKFYEYVEALPEKEWVDFGYQKATLLASINERLKKIKKRESNEIELLVYGTPKTDALIRKIRALMTQYESKTQSSFFGNSSRLSLVKFILFISQSCEKNYNYPKIDREDNQQECAYLQMCNVLLGGIVYGLLSIQKEYKLRTAENSELYKLLLQTFNAKNLESIPYQKRVFYLKALSSHLELIKGEHKDRSRELSKRQLEIDTFVVTQEKLCETPSRSVNYLSTATGYAAQYGLGFALSQFTNTFALPAIVGTVVGGVAGMTGPLGLVIYGATGAIMMTQLGRLVKDRVIPSAAASIFAWALARIGKTVANKTAAVATYTFVADRPGFRALLNDKAIKAEDRQFIMEWINTLLKLPENIMSDEEKSHIREFLGISDALDESFFMVKDEGCNNHAHAALSL